MKKKISLQSLGQHYGHAFELGELIVEKKTPYQTLSIYETPALGKMLLLDGVTQLTEKGEYFYHEVMAHVPLLSHPNPENVLIIGGGDGGVLREVLKHGSIKNVGLVELDGDVIDFTQKHLPLISNGAFNDKRVKIFIEDGRGFIEKTKEQYDVIIMDMTDPFGPSVALYTKQFFTLIKNKGLRPDGIFFMHSESPILTPKMYASINATLKTVFNYHENHYIYLQMYGGLWSFAMSSSNIFLNDVELNIIEKRMAHRLKTPLKLINKAVIRAIKTEYLEFSTLKETGFIISDGYEGFDEINPKKLLFSDDFDQL